MPPSCCDTCNDTCPEQADVTVEETNVTIDGTGLELTVSDLAVPVADSKLVTIQVDTAGYWRVKLWFQDNAVPSATNKSLVAPTEPGVIELDIMTDAAGEYILTVTNAALRTWYLAAEMFGAITVSAAITVGV